jgi:hypothetical protein
MSLEISTVKQVLMQKGFEKIFVVESRHDCVLLLIEFKGVNILAGIYKGLHSVYAKVVRADDLLEPYWRCDYLEYIPQGLYTFSESKNIEELAQKIVAKAEIIIKRSSQGIE